MVWGYYFISITKAAFKNIGALIIGSIKFLSHELYIVINLLNHHAWNTVVMSASSCYLELLDKLLKSICRTDGPSLSAFLEPLSHHSNAANIIGITLVDVHLNWLNWFHFLIFEETLLVM